MIPVIITIHNFIEKLSDGYLCLIIGRGIFDDDIYNIKKIIYKKNIIHKSIILCS